MGASIGVNENKRTLMKVAMDDVMSIILHLIQNIRETSCHSSFTLLGKVITYRPRILLRIEGLLSTFTRLFSCMKLYENRLQCNKHYT